MEKLTGMEDRKLFLRAAIQSVLNTRELCGNEDEALDQAAADYGIKLTPEVLHHVFSEVNRRWREYQKDAGVHPKYL